MKTVLVTGASSAIAQRLIDRLLPEHRVLAMEHRRAVDTRGGQLEVLPGGLEFCSDHAARIREADAIVHLAAVTRSRDASHYEHVNHVLTRRLLENARAGQRLIHVSTVCAQPSGGAYGASKWRAEEVVRATRLEWTIVRPSEVYGLGGGEGIDSLINLARRTGLLVDLRNPDSVRYAPVSGNRVAQFLLGAVNRTARPNATYTLCANQPCTAHDMAAALKRAGKRVRCVPVPVALLRALMRLPFPTPLVPDQLDRLVMAKDLDNRSARQDCGFDPGDFLADLAAGVV